MKRGQIKINIENQNPDDNEDLTVLDLLDSLIDNRVDYLEVGSGLCRFPKKISKIYKNLNISCVEINPSLAEIAKNEGYGVINTDFLNNGLPDNNFDVVHCSHVIEHFRYPDIIHIVDELLRVTKIGGYLVIHSPLMWKGFYDDIDHVRPYPPEAILNYLYNPQQQVQGRNKITVEKIWYRTMPKQFDMVDRTNFIYCLKLTRRIVDIFVSYINKINIKLWNSLRWPASKPNGYVMIIKKIA